MSYPYIPLWLVLGVLGCGQRPASQPAAPSEATSGPDADTTFYQEISWAPDGSRFLLSALQHGSYRILAFRADGTQPTPLTDGPRDLWTSWAPDGSHIAFSSKSNDNVDIYVMLADGTGRVRLTDHPADESAPAWSPDGSRIAFTSRRDGASHLYVMNTDGSEQTRISQGPGEAWNPAWAPDGSQIAFYATEDAVDYIYVMNADGSHPARLTRGVWPAWSPDGSRLLYTFGERGQPPDVYVMQADGTQPTRLVSDGFFARWSPDGRHITFLRTTWRAPSGWPATSNVYTVNADGSGVQPLIPGNR